MGVFLFKNVAGISEDMKTLTGANPGYRRPMPGFRGASNASDLDERMGARVRLGWGVDAMWTKKKGGGCPKSMGSPYRV